MKVLSLQPLTSLQVPQAVALDRICFSKLWTADGYRRELNSPNSDLLVLRYETDGRSRCACESESAAENGHQDETDGLVGIGCEWAIVDEAHVTLVGVHPQYQRQGFGALLLWAILTLGRHRGLAWATLEVRPSNQPARSLYDKFGFELVGQRRRYYSDTGEDALILWLRQLQSDKVGDRLRVLGRQAHHRLTQQGWQLTPMAEPLRSLWTDMILDVEAGRDSKSSLEIADFITES